MRCEDLIPLFNENASAPVALMPKNEERKFGIDKFDVIIGNPPFQDEITENDIKKPRKGGKNKLYERITIKCLTLLNNS